MPEAIGFDIYSTLVDPLEMNRHLRPLVGDPADRFAQLWRQKQLEYSIRRGLMRKYENFGVCTEQALLFAMYTLKVDLSDEDQERLIEEWQNLRALPDVAPGMEALKARGHRLVAFSNGVEATARTLLERAGILRYLEGVVSVDDLKTFKPDPEVYRYLARRLDRSMSETWLVSGSPRDVIGAKSAGLKAAWIKRSPEAVFDPWGIEPDVVVGDLEELSERLG
jgi:2-haloacid dehalogenase